MKMTSAEAAKLLRKLNDELVTLRRREDNSKSFIASLGEEPETVRPEYDYSEMQEQQKEIEKKIRKVKHAVNVFNSTYVIPEYGFTIDEMLVYLPQITTRHNRLSQMKDALPKVRERSIYSGSSSIIDYRYANYDIKVVSDDYNTISDELAKAQTALDFVNSTVEFEVEI